MARIILIAAVGQNLELGKNNGLIWHLKEDMHFFKEHTTNHKIVMGYKTFLSLGRLLPNREHIVLTHHHCSIDNVSFFHDYESLYNYLSTFDEDIYIIGGSSIYRLFLNDAHELLLTEIHDNCQDADVYFPTFSTELFQKRLLSSKEENGVHFDHVQYTRKKTITNI